MSLQSKGFSRIFSNTTVQKHQFFGTQLCLQSNSWLLRPVTKHIQVTLSKISRINELIFISDPIFHFPKPMFQIKNWNFLKVFYCGMADIQKLVYISCIQRNKCIILQARILEWVAVPFSRGSSPTQGSNPGLQHCRRVLYHLSYQRSLISVEISIYP